MTGWPQAAPSSCHVGTHLVILTSLIVLCGCSGQGDAVPRPSPVNPQQPKASLAVQPPADRMNLKPGSPLDVLCTVIVDPASFEPVIVAFQVSDSMTKGKSKTVFNSETINKNIAKDDTYTFRWTVKCPDKPGRYFIEAKVMGIDPSRPTQDPPPAPAADGTRIRPGARVEFDALALKSRSRNDTARIPNSPRQRTGCVHAD